MHAQAASTQLRNVMAQLHSNQIYSILDTVKLQKEKKKKLSYKIARNWRDEIKLQRNNKKNQTAHKLANRSEIKAATN